MGRRTVYTKITPLPSNVPRQLALDMLHSHEEVIKLNPLVTGVKSCEAPRNAQADEFFSTWYEITEILSVGLGFKKKIAFKGVFHDTPWGLQSHVYPPGGVDMRNKYRIGGNQPGEPREAREIGVDTPLDGLYLREDVEIICNVPLTTSFVLKEAKAATGVMIQRLARKAELLDEGKLHAMFENGMLKTARPTRNVNMSPEQPDRSPIDGGSEPSPTNSSPAMRPDSSFGRYHDVAKRQSQRGSTMYSNGYPTPPGNGQYGGLHTTSYELAGHTIPEAVEAPGSLYYKPQGQGQVFRSELPGDTPNLTPDPAVQSVPSSSSPPQNYQRYSSPPPPRAPEYRRGSSGNYNIANPDPESPRTTSYQQYPSQQRQPSNNSNAEWQQGLGIDGLQSSTASQNADPDLTRNSSTYSQRSQPQYYQPPPNNTTTATTNTLMPNAHRFSQMSINSSTRSSPMPPPQISPRPASLQPYQAPLPDSKQSPYWTAPPSVSTKCPVCGVFEGDEAAVSHHVGQSHFA